MSNHVLITGGAGFIGSHLAEALLQKGYHVTVIDDLSTGRFENIQHLLRQRSIINNEPLLNFVIDSITNEVVMDQLVSACDVIFHLAAAVGVKFIIENPVHSIETNVKGSEVVLKTALRYRAKVLIASTSEVYGKGNKIPFREDDDVILGPTNCSRWGYAASKMIDEFLALAYYQKKGLPVVIFRLFNTAGPRQVGQYGMVIPRFVRQALQGEPLTVYGDGKQSRCFLHVKDVVKALIALSECPQAIGQVFNVGSIEEISMLELAQKVLALVDEAVGSQKVEKNRIAFIPYEKAYSNGFQDMLKRVPDISKIRMLTGWKPKRELDEILRNVIVHFMNKKPHSPQPFWIPSLQSSIYT